VAEDDVMEAHARAARAAWPDIVVEPARFAAEVQRRIAGAEGVTVASVKGPDVWIAIACVDGNEKAILAVTEMLRREVQFAATKTTASREQIEDVVAKLSHVLFIDEPTRPAALRDYSGRGDLKSYLRVTAMRELVKVVNKGRREVGIEDDELLDRIVPHSDPELSILRAQYHDVVDAAMRAALQTLDERGRALLRHAFVDGWNVDRVGELYKVHRATAARWIAAVRDQLGEHIRDELAQRLRVPVDDVDSIIRLVQSRIDVSLARVLA
jgi:RNA polymerase sigma-70 factor (ECF subfamily)